MLKYLALILILFSGVKALAHPMPSSVVKLSVMDRVIRGDAKIPILELANAVGDDKIADMQSPFFRKYFQQHIRANSSGREWNTTITSVSVISGRDSVVGNFQEVEVGFTMTPPGIDDLRRFRFDYDVVMHQVVTHSALVYIEQDWNNGVQGAEGTEEIGIIKMDIPTEKISPLEVNLENGSWWKGFRSMLVLGMEHIRQGTDHLLFLIVLLLPAMLIAGNKSWGAFGGIRYSISRLLKIITAFTIGHSITLIFGALGLIKFPGQPIEILIAFSILVSAVHAIRPIFPGKEILIAGGFGLIHGLAFASALANLQLSAGQLVLSILGFNLGIELMQLFVIGLIIPSLILLSKTKIYGWVRIISASGAGIASIAWIIQRSTGKDNKITAILDIAIDYGPWAILVLAIVAVLVYALLNEKNKRNIWSAE